MRQQMEMHRKNEPCATCHKIMDPIGFSMENFDAIGQWRVIDGDSPVDASGFLVDGSRARWREGNARSAGCATRLSSFGF